MSYLGTPTFWEEYETMQEFCLLVSMGHPGMVVLK